MAETLGSLCDKLTIVKLKQWHARDRVRVKSLARQEIQLQEEIDCFIVDTYNGKINEDRLRFDANKVYKKKGNTVAAVSGKMGKVISQLADANCRLWHEQEKVYDFDQVPDTEKGVVVKKLAVLNLERNHCIEAIDRNFYQEVIRRRKKKK